MTKCRNEGSTERSLLADNECMNERGSQLLDAHIRSLDPGEPIARERLEAELGDALARKLVFALCLMPLPPRRQILAP